MKANEILIRQDRVVYILMVLVASLGLLWSLWQHRHPDGAIGKAATAQPTAAKAPAAKTVYVR